MKIQLPIDTAAVPFIDVMPSGPVLDRQTKQEKADANGEPPVLDRAGAHRGPRRQGPERQVRGHSPGRDPAGMQKWRATGSNR
jgi:hypothetical protein